MGAVDHPKPDYPPVTLCELRPYGKGKKYWVEFASKWQPPHEKQKKPPAKKKGLWLTRCTTILHELNKHSLYSWYAQKAAEWFQRKINEGWGPERLTSTASYWEAANAAVTQRDEAAYVGSQTHGVIEEYLTTGFWPDCSEMLPETRHALACWQDWWEYARLTPAFVEMKVYSLTGRYGGTTDLLAYNEQGQLVIVDWKTSSDVYSEHKWQLAAYAKALGEMGMPVPDIGIIVRIPKKFHQLQPEWVIAWETPEELLKLQSGFSAFVLALSLRPGKVKLQTFGGGEREVANADGLYDQPEDDQAEAELNELFRFG